MVKTTEWLIGIAVMRVLATCPNGEATVRYLIQHVPDYVTLMKEDRERSWTRPNEEMWEQQVRNLKSHGKTRGNVIAEGYVQHVGWGRYRLSEAGWRYLRNRQLIDDLSSLRVFSPVARLEPFQFGFSWRSFVPYKPSARRRAGPFAYCAGRVESNPLAEYPHARGWNARKYGVGSICPFQKSKSKQQCKFTSRVLHAACDKTLSAVVWRISHNVVGRTVRFQKIVPGLAVTAFVKV